MFVLSAGLASCAPDNQRDNFRASPPKIVGGGQKVNLKDFVSLNAQELDLQQAFDFKESGANQVRIKSSCAFDKDTISISRTFSTQSLVYVFEAIPDETLFIDFNAVPTACTFELTLSNSLGSKHIMNLPTVSLIEREPSALKIENNDGNELTPPIRLADGYLTNLRMAFPHRGDANLSFNCQDMKTRPIIFEQHIDGIDLNIGEATVRPGRNLDALAINPLQKCRAQIAIGSHIVAMSPPLEIVIPWSPWAITQSQAYTKPISSNRNDRARFFMKFLREKSSKIDLARIQIRNNELHTRYLKLAKTTPGLTLILLHRRTARYESDTFPYTLAPQTIEWVIPKAWMAKQTSSDYIIAVPGHSTLDLRLRVNPRFLFCSEAGTPIAFKIVAKGNIVLNEVDHQGQVLLPINLNPIAPTVVINEFDPSFFTKDIWQTKRINSNGCHLSD